MRAELRTKCFTILKHFLLDLQNTSKINQKFCGFKKTRLAPTKTDCLLEISRRPETRVQNDPRVTFPSRKCRVHERMRFRCWARWATPSTNRRLRFAACVSGRPAPPGNLRQQSLINMLGMVTQTMMATSTVCPFWSRQVEEFLAWN